jgi:hypothetical protein
MEDHSIECYVVPFWSAEDQQGKRDCIEIGIRGVQCSSVGWILTAQNRVQLTIIENILKDLRTGLKLTNFLINLVTTSSSKLSQIFGVKEHKFVITLVENKS